MSDGVIVDAADRPLILRMRKDLRVCPQWYRGQRHWLLKDPVSLRYYHLLDEEFAILEMLDGEASIADIQQRFGQRFAPRRLRPLPLQSFLGELHRCGLVISEATNQSETLLQRGAEQRRRAWTEAIGNLLALRLPGIDPTPLLQRLQRPTEWLFSRWAFTIWLLVIVTAAMLVAVRFDVLMERLPDFRNFFAAGNLIALALTLAGIKVLHELAHAVACRHFGGECHEIGLMLLIFTPCLYCDVSDAWTLPNKWQRIIVSAAGIYVELFVAAICTFLWWYSDPGLLNSLCLNAMVICSVSTLLFNGNPLLRFDGYYILVDLLEIPNLQARAKSAATQFVARWSLGVDLSGERAISERASAWLTGFALASAVYRWVVIVGTVFVLSALLKPYHLEQFAVAFMFLAVLGATVEPVRRGIRFWLNPAMQRQIQHRKAMRSIAILVLVAAAVWFCPLPYRISAPVMLQPAGASYVYATIPGTLSSATRSNVRVASGDELARLVDPALEKEIIRLTSQRNQQRLQVRQLESRRGQDADAAAQLPAAQQLLAELDVGSSHVQRMAEQLVVRSPVSGTVLAPPRITARPPAPGRLVTWTGTPLDPINRGSYLEAGTLVCLVGDPRRLLAVAFVDQGDVEFVTPGQHVELRIEQLPGEAVAGVIEEVARIDVEAEPRQLSALGGLPSRVDAYGVARPLTTAYQARIALDLPSDHTLLAGAPGTCRIRVPPQSLGQRLVRYVRSTFRFSL